MLGASTMNYVQKNKKMHIDDLTKPTTLDDLSKADSLTFSEDLKPCARDAAAACGLASMAFGEFATAASTTTPLPLEESHNHHSRNPLTASQLYP